MTSAQSPTPTSTFTKGPIKQSNSNTLLDSFGKRVDPVYSKILLTRVKTLLQSSENTGFPGTQPVNFEPKHFDILAREDYFVCEKSDGVRCLLFFVHSPKGPASFMLDRNQRWYFVPDILFPERGRDNEYLKDTLMDGELVVNNDEHTKQSLRFLIFDLMALNGLSITQKSFSTRLGVLQQDVIQPHKLSLRSQSDSLKSHPPFTVELKKMERSYGLHLVFEQISKLRHDSDGIIWTPVKCPYVPGVCDRLLKWKPPEKITVDFKINAKWSKDHKPIYSLNVLSHLTYKFFDHFQPDSDRAFEWKDQPPDGRIAEFRYDSTWLVTIVEQGYAPTTRTGGWRFVRFRDDKDSANNQADAEQIIHSIQDGVSKEQLLTHMEYIRDAWKAREKGLPPPPSLAHPKSRTGERVVNGSASASTLASNQQSLPTPSHRSLVLPSSDANSSLHHDQDYSKPRQRSMDYGSAGRYDSTAQVMHDDGASTERESSETHSHHHTQSLPGSRRQSFEVSPKRNGNTKKEDTERKRHKSLTEMDKSHRQHLEARRHTHPHMNNVNVDKDNTKTDYTSAQLSPTNNILMTPGVLSVKSAATSTTSSMISNSLSTVHEEDSTVKVKENNIRKLWRSAHPEIGTRQQQLGRGQQNVDSNTSDRKPVATSTKIELGSKANGSNTAFTQSSNQKYQQDLRIPLPSDILHPSTLQKDNKSLDKTDDLVGKPQSPVKNSGALSSDDSYRQDRLEGSYTRYDPTRSSPSTPNLPLITSNGHTASSPLQSPTTLSQQRTSLSVKRPTSQSIHSLLTSSIEPIPSPTTSKIKKELASTDRERSSAILDNRSILNDQHRQQQQHKAKIDIRPRPDEHLHQQPHQQQHVKTTSNSPYQATGMGSRASASTHTFPIQFINFHADRSSVQDGSPSSQQKTVFIQGECLNDNSIDQRTNQLPNYPHSWQQTSISEPYNMASKYRKSQGTLNGSSTSSSPTSSPRRSTSGRQLDTWRVTKIPIQQTPPLTPSQQQPQQPIRQDYVDEKNHQAQVQSTYNYPAQQHPYPYSSYYTSPQPDITYQQRIRPSHDYRPSLTPQPTPTYLHYQHTDPSPTDASQRKSSKAKLDFILN